MDGHVIGGDFMSYGSEEKSKSIRKICLISSALFNLSACVYGWTAPIGAALGCVATLTNDFDESTSEELQDAIEEAFELTVRNTSASSHRMILEELVYSEVNPENLYDLIQKTEAFQTQYCTNSDTQEILSSFEMHFRDRISRHPNLSRLYILSTGITTLEQLKKICEAIYLENNAVESIKNETRKINHNLRTLSQLITICANEIAFVLVSMAIFLLIGVFSKNGFVQLWIYSALISYTISGLLTQLLKRNKRDVKTHSKASMHFAYEMLLFLILPTLISLSCFLMIVMAVNNQGVPIYFNLISSENEPKLSIAILALITGSLCSRMMRIEPNKRSTI